MKDWHDMRNDEFEKYLIEVYGDTSWKAYLFKTRPPQIITVLCGVLSIIIAAVVILMYRHNATDTDVRWWERSPASSYSNSFCTVVANGSANYYNASISQGVSTAFKV